MSFLVVTTTRFFIVRRDLQGDLWLNSNLGAGAFKSIPLSIMAMRESLGQEFLLVSSSAAWPRVTVGNKSWRATRS